MLAEKMILDWDYLPLPAMMDESAPAKASQAKQKNRKRQ